jgi:hypothetical protein
MDSLSNRTLTHLFEMLHDGPLKDIIQFMAQQTLRCTRNCDMETALRMTMTFVFTIERLRHARLADWGVSDVSMLAPAAAPPTRRKRIARNDDATRTNSTKRRRDDNE